VFGTSIAIQSPEALKIVEIILSIAFCVGQHAQKSRAGFPDDFAMLIKAPHGISALLIFSQNLRDELASGQFAVLSSYVLTGDIHPKLQGLVHSEFHLLNVISVKTRINQN
jgi:hypothetical protein